MYKSFLVTLQMPDGVDVEQMSEYIQEAVGIYANVYCPEFKLKLDARSIACREYIDSDYINFNAIAREAMNGLLAAWTYQISDVEPKWVAARAYECAVAMEKERKRLLEATTPADATGASE